MKHLKNRSDVVGFINSQFNYNDNDPVYKSKMGQYHYGKQELRALLDYLYDETPTGKSDLLL